MKNKSDKTTISIGKAAALLGVHTDTIRNWERSGLLVSSRTPGGHRRYVKSDVEKFNGGKMSDKIVKNWESTGLLQVFKEKKSGAIALENQRRFNEAVNDLTPQFMRNSIPLVVRILSTLPSFTSSLYGEYGEPLVTDIEFANSATLDEEAKSCAVLALGLRLFIENWAREHNTVPAFKALGLVDGKVAIYGLAACD